MKEGSIVSDQNKKNRKDIKYKPYFHKELSESNENKEKPIEFLENVPLRISVELSKQNITMADLLSLKEGSIIELDKLAGEAMDILVNNEYLARGEIVDQNGNYAVRLTDMSEKKEILNEKYNDEET
jgi:flagellar motor switch protein FliN/FliY